MENLLNAERLPPELYKQFLIPLFYEETLTHCIAYQEKNKINVCQADLWKAKVEYFSPNERQKLFINSVKNNHKLYIPPLLLDKNVNPVADDHFAIKYAVSKRYYEIVKLALARAEG